MDPLSTTASIAGILSLVAQSINGIESLRKFVKDVRNAPKILNSFLREIDAFQESLSQIQKLLVQLSTTQQAQIEPLELHALRSQVGRCVADIEKWVASAAKIDPASSHGIAAFFKKLRVAMNKDGVSEFHRQIATHQQGLGISLSVLGPYLTLQGLNRFNTFTAQVTKKLETSTSYFPTREIISQAHSKTVDQLKSWAEVGMKSPIMEKLENVEISARSITSHSMQSSEDIKSLSDAVSTMSSEISQLREALSRPKSPKCQEVYCCAAILGIEQAFEEEKCLYCGEEFDGVDWTSRGCHLVSVHNFDGCDTSIVYNRWDRKEMFTKHLTEFHAQKTKISYWRFSRTQARPLIQDRLLVDFKKHSYDLLRSSTESLRDKGAASSEDSSVLDFLTDLDFIKRCFRDADVGNVSRYIMDLNHSALCLFWEIDWKLRCLFERCIIKDAEEKFWRKVLPDMPSKHVTISTILSKIRSNEDLGIKVDIFELYLQKVHEYPGAGAVFDKLDCLDYSAQIYSWGKAIALYSFHPQDEMELPLFAGQVVWVWYQHHQEGWLWVEDQETYKSGRIPRKCVRQFVDTPRGLHSLDGQVGLSDPSRLAAYRSGASTIELRDRVRSWLCQFIHDSRTIRVLASRNSGIVTVENPNTHPWVSLFIKQWDAPAQDVQALEDMRLQLSSDGAIDSRDDLISEHCKMALKVKSIFEDLNLTQYLDRFIDEGFDTWDRICLITEKDFVTLGVKLGHRRILRRKISDSKESFVKETKSHRQTSFSTSLSSMPSISETSSIDDWTSCDRGMLMDTYGNKFKLANYTIRQIRDAIPARCYERSSLRGLYHVFRDVVALATTFYFFNKFVTPEYIPFIAVRGLLWALYTIIQGLFATGLWVLGHECGHQSLLPSAKLNNTIGFICHSALLVPYFSWKFSHAKHHKANGNMERDMVNVPETRVAYASRLGRPAHELSELVEESPIYTAMHLVGQQLLGWFLYILTNKTGHDYHERQIEGRGVRKKNGFFGGVNHFNPASPLYYAKDAKLVLLSDLGLAVAGTVLVTLARAYSFTNIAVWYFIPYLWVNHWLVAITYLQHTDPTLPRYAPESWTYVRGAAATIDRDFGFIGRHLFHGFIETHVLHHHVSTIPFYHAEDATKAIKKVMGRHYRSDCKGGSLGFLQSMWRNARWCQWVEPSEGAQGEAKGVFFYRNRNGLGVPPQKDEG